MAGIGQKPDPHHRPQKHAGQSARHNRRRKRPDHPALAPVGPDPGRTGQDIEKLIGGAHTGVDVAQHAHLKGQKQQSARDAAHAGKKGNAQRDEKGQDRIACNACGGKVHGAVPVGGGPGAGCAAAPPRSLAGAPCPVRPSGHEAQNAAKRRHERPGLLPGSDER